MKLSVQGAVEHMRDFYLCTAEEMRQRWQATPTQSNAYGQFCRALPRRMRQAFDTKYADHNPLWEFIRAFQYGAALADDDPQAWEFDAETQKPVRMYEYYLWEPLHKVEMCDRIIKYLTEPQPIEIRGLAVFVLREGLKSRIFVVGTGAWLLTRHRILFSDFTGIRILHDVESEAKQRAEWIKTLLTYNTALRALYPEVAIPQDRKWGTFEAWDLPGAEGRAGDPQVAAFGARSRLQGTHYPYTLIDDLESPDHKTSVASRDETERYFNLLKYSGKGTQRKTILAGTFYSPFGIHSNIAESFEEWQREAGEEKRKTRWDVVRLPAILEEGIPPKYSKKNLSQTGGERSIYPNRFPLEFLKAESQEEIDSTGDDLDFRMQRMLDFKARGKYEFDLERWGAQQLDLDDPGEDGLSKQVAEALDSATCIVFADLAGKDEGTKGKGDSSAIVALKFPNVDGRVHVVAVDSRVNKEYTLEEGCAAQLQMAHAWGASMVVAEENPSHRVLGEMLNRTAKELSLPYYQTVTPQGKQLGNILTLKPRASSSRAIGTISSWKMGRMRSFRSKWNSGLVWLSASCEGLDALFETLKTFPFCPEQIGDDLLDAMSQSEEVQVSSRLPSPHPRGRRRKRQKRETMRLGRYTGLVVRK